MKSANTYAKRILANPELCGQAQVRLNVTRNKLYTTLIREFFADHQKEKDKKAAAAAS